MSRGNVLAAAAAAAVVVLLVVVAVAALSAPQSPDVAASAPPAPRAATTGSEATTTDYGADYAREKERFTKLSSPELLDEIGRLTREANSLADDRRAYIEVEGEYDTTYDSALADRRSSISTAYYELGSRDEGGPEIEAGRLRDVEIPRAREDVEETRAERDAFAAKKLPSPYFGDELAIRDSEAKIAEATLSAGEAQLRILDRGARAAGAR